MKILFIHQNFPGQYLHILRRLSRLGGHQVIGLGLCKVSPGSIPSDVRYFQYQLSQGNGQGVHHLAREMESKVIRAEGVARAASRLSDQGFDPDLICVHPGWGEAMFLRTVWPDVPVLCYQEFFYREHGFDANFDPEFLGERCDWDYSARIIMKNAYLQVTLDQAAWNISPTHFQASSFPEHWHRKISVIHDGVDLQQARPNPSPAPLQLPDGTVLEKGQPIVTFVNRCLEPYRGCHTFIRAIPELQRQHPEARIVVVGRTKGVSYGAVCPDGEWGDRFLAEIKGQYDPSRVHFTGTLPYEQFIPLLQLSACHVYLTYPFVLSWSLLEAMGCGCAVVGSDTAPVREVIRHGQNGVLVNFFSPTDLAAAVVEILNDPERAAAFGVAARETVERTYELNACVTRQLALMDLVASRSIVV